jgi:hypothetical protein
LAPTEKIMHEPASTEMLDEFGETTTIFMTFWHDQRHINPSLTGQSIKTGESYQ